MLSDLTAKTLPAASGDDVYLRGIYRLHDQSLKARSADAAALLAQVAGRTVAVIDISDLDALEAKWLAPLSRALLGGAIAKLTVMFDDWRIETARAEMFKLWRRELQPVKWAAC